MENGQNNKPNLEMLKTTTRRGIRLSPEELVHKYYLDSKSKLPLVIEPILEGLDLITWGRNNRAMIDQELLEHGALLFRNFKPDTVVELEQFIRAVSGEPVEYQEQSSPRHRLSRSIYSSTDYPSHQTIFLHNENSYAHSWPLKLFFLCLTPAQEGGETPIADIRRIFRRIQPEIRDKFMAKKVLYVRNFTEGLGLAWQTVYQSDDRAVIEASCRKIGYEVEWLANNGLRTRRVAQAVARHPLSGEMAWFNHAAFFHITTLEPRIQKALLEECGEEGLPNNTYYGDGEPIELATLDALREAYRQETVLFPWKQGDLLMLDNMSVAHGRMPYKGARQIAVGMSEAFSYDALQQEPEAKEAGEESSPG